jgi:hypothetical protein
MGSTLLEQLILKNSEDTMMVIMLVYSFIIQLKKMICCGTGQPVDNRIHQNRPAETGKIIFILKYSAVRYAHWNS